jgi:carbonic anhydrase
MKKIVDGVLKFQKEVFPKKKALFASLAAEQKPRVLFITCGDSRIVPDLMTQSNPGELFILRNAGNIVPPDSDTAGGVTATIEYAVVALNIPNIIICGHSNCGAMKAVLHPESLADMPKVAPWLRHADSAARMVRENYPQLPESERLEILTKENIVTQLEHLKTHPSVAARLARGAINLFGWYYDIKTGSVQAYDVEIGDFVVLDGNRIPSATPKPRQRMSVVKNQPQPHGHAVALEEEVAR